MVPLVINRLALLLGICTFVGTAPVTAAYAAPVADVGNHVGNHKKSLGTSRLYQSGLAAYKAGRFLEAQSKFMQVLAVEPSNQ